MRKLLVSLGLGAVLATSAFALSGPMAHIFKSEVKANAKYVKYITPQELKKWMDEDKDFVVLDVREPAETAAGTVDWIELEKIPRGLVDVKAAVGYLKPNNTYVVICKTGGRATLAGAKLVKQYGFKHVYVLKGGMVGWMKAGYTVVNKLGKFKAAK
ncbi:rhodanese-like domain-containing protein [Nautilia lithotrophica]